jgi:hypothetical protein
MAKTKLNYKPKDDSKGKVKQKRLIYFPLRIRREEDEKRNPEKYVIRDIKNDIEKKVIVNSNAGFFD